MEFAPCLWHIYFKQYLYDNHVVILSDFLPYFISSQISSARTHRSFFDSCVRVNLTTLNHSSCMHDTLNTDERIQISSRSSMQQSLVSRQHCAMASRVYCHTQTLLVALSSSCSRPTGTSTPTDSAPFIVPCFCHWRNSSQTMRFRWTVSWSLLTGVSSPSSSQRGYSLTYWNWWSRVCR